MTVAAILNSKGPEVVAIRPDQTLEAAAKLMTERRIGSVLVMDGEDVAGILSERDIVRAIAGHGVAAIARTMRSEERRVGKECRSRWSPYH